MDVFDLRNRLIDEYGEYVSSFIRLRDGRIQDHVRAELHRGVLWPDPLIQLNPAFERGETIDELVAEGVMHAECAKIFRRKPSPTEDLGTLHLHRHQADAVRVARGGHNYVLTTGTGSGKSLAYIIPIVDHVLRAGPGSGIKAIVVYPMNALANSQEGELGKFLCHGYDDGRGPIRFARYTGQENDEQKQRIIQNPPDILLTNFVMLELVLTRPRERPLIAAARGLRFLVLDELHTYRGRQGADVAMLVRRTRDALEATSLRCVGTSATVAGVGTYAERCAQVAEVATQLFGDTVEPAHVIGETLRRATPVRQESDMGFGTSLREAVVRDTPLPRDYAAFLAHPLSSWIESTFGLKEEPGTGRLVRTDPRSLTGPRGAARQLAELTRVEEATCAGAIARHLLASYAAKDPETGFPAFAFRLHQFISRGDTVYATLEDEATRYLTLNAQQFKPGDRDRVLLPLVFCRECGQEYYCVTEERNSETGRRTYTARELSDRAAVGAEVPGFLYESAAAPWPETAQEVIERVPEDWVEERQGIRRIKRTSQASLPARRVLGMDGVEQPDGAQGIVVFFLKTPFRFCLQCGVTYGARQQSDFPKLASLGTEGRSTATTVLSLSAIRYLRTRSGLAETARKLLSFTDNRQDASLQAGHFNDFIEVGLLRSALHQAVARAGTDGLEHDVLVPKVFDALDLPLALYGADPDVKFEAKRQTERALRGVLGYRIYRDLQRGWRITSPNLEQCGLLEIRYLSLDEVCADEPSWAGMHPALVGASPEIRARVAKVLLDFMRRELAIKVDYLDPERQEQIVQQSAQRLSAPWAFDERERLERASTIIPRSAKPGDRPLSHGLSPVSGFGLYLSRSSTFPDFSGPLGSGDRLRIFADLLRALASAGLVEVVAKAPDDEPEYQVVAASMQWVAGDGTRAFHDPIRMPRQPEGGLQTNRFFRALYTSDTADQRGLEAREHTAQVTSDERISREVAFRTGRLPILYCSPTMELGVDIADLNVVNMRNVPPTPANYAQRSGRAGRSGQPALVFSYCSGFSPHDQYFFRRPERMVAGAVTPPRLELANEDLVRAHVQAVWLAESGLDLHDSLKDILEVGGDAPTLELQSSVRAAIDDVAPRRRTLARATRLLDPLLPELRRADWWSDAWLEEVMQQVPLQFDRACDRWRNLYRAALAQFRAQNAVITDASRSFEDKATARRLRAESEAQLHLLTEGGPREGDFYSYRYFASEGFLPGYNFPRLPLSAFIPARRNLYGRDEYLSRPRFLAISEFGPRAIIYHEGSRYRVHKVILPVGPEQQDVLTTAAKQCGSCGYLHPIGGGPGPDLCERCSVPLPNPLTPLFRLQNVATRRAERINSDEEERLRLGYDLRTGVRFAMRGQQPSRRLASVTGPDGPLATLTYGHAATLWRINLGWRRRADRDRFGFVLDVARGFWARNPGDVADDDDDNPRTQTTRRVIPYVEDRRNCLLIEPAVDLSDAVMASLQAALKNAIQVEYQLEDGELAAEPLPATGKRRLLLFYEAAEGGAGVLRRLVDDPEAMARLGRCALDLCHFDPDTGDDRRRAPRATEDCEAGCYDCLMSYTNQPDHPLLDRQQAKTLLQRLMGANVEASPGERPRAEHLQALLRACGSSLEAAWLDLLETHGLALPSGGQVLVRSCGTRPDFVYDEHNVGIYVDGPHHEFPERQARDGEQTARMEDTGWTVIRFGHRDDWLAIIRSHPGVFGRLA